MFFISFREKNCFSEVGKKRKSILHSIEWQKIAGL